MKTFDNQKIKKAIIAVAEKQIADNDPPETAATLARLLDSGYSRDEALKLIGFVVGQEFFGVVAQGIKYDEGRFIGMLKDLPKLPWSK